MDRETFVAACVEQLRATPAAAKLSDEEELPDGRWVYLNVNTVSSGGTVAVVTDVKPLKQLQSFYEVRAHHDALTGLPNRQLFQDRLSHAAARIRRGGGKLAVLYIDLDAFKPINDTLGHAAGDTVLQEVAQRLRDAVRESDTLTRLGGDEFAVLLEIEGDAERAESVATRILLNLAAPVTVSDQTCKVGASIGIVASLAAGKRIEAIMQRADAAMYEAKQRGGGVFCWGTVWECPPSALSPITRRRKVWFVPRNVGHLNTYCTNSPRRAWSSSPKICSAASPGVAQAISART